MKRFLVTTALEETWREDLPVLFLGEWCKIYDRKEKWSLLDAEVIPYHWDDRKKLEKDYHYLTGLYEHLLPELAKQLNTIHNRNLSVHYWRIVVGVWLGYFIQILFDRWTCIQQASKEYEISGTTCLSHDVQRAVPNDMEAFLTMLSEDEWNHYIYNNIIQEATSIPYTTKENKLTTKTSDTSGFARVLKKINRQRRHFFSNISGYLSRQEHDAFFLHTYLSVADEKKLSDRFNKRFQKRFTRPVNRFTADPKKRSWILKGEGDTPFEVFLCKMVPRQIPKAYIEGYRAVVQQTEKLGWPKRPKVMFTSTSFSSDDVFKVWSAQRREEGSPLVIGQHGGHYGIGRWSFTEAHEISTSDAYLSWGWDDKNHPKVRPVGQLKEIGERDNGKKRSGALLVTCVFPRYSYFMLSAIVAGQYLSYFNDQVRFIEALPDPIKEALIVRLYSHDFGWGQQKRFTERLPNIRFDRKSSMKDLIEESRVYISTYNATTFLEAINLDMPTIIYWNPEYWELRDDAIPYFSQLEEAGIFHKTPESAAWHLAAVWNDIETWWHSAVVRTAVNRFKQRFCEKPDNLIDRIEHEFYHAINVSEKRG